MIKCEHKQGALIRQHHSRHATTQPTDTYQCTSTKKLNAQVLTNQRKKVLHIKNINFAKLT